MWRAARMQGGAGFEACRVTGSAHCSDRGFQMRLVVFVPLLLATPVFCAGYERTFIANWTVETKFDACVAYNRPTVEVTAHPVNMLALSREADGSTALVVSYWPGALALDGMEMELDFGGQPMRMTADGRRDYQSLRIEALPDEALRQLQSATAESGPLTITATASGAVLVFDISHIAAVFAELGRCAETLG
jgi:hypothetical protein